MIGIKAESSTFRMRTYCLKIANGREMYTLTRSSGELVLQSAWPLPVLPVQCLANVHLTSLSALYQLQRLILLSALYDVLRKKQTGSVSCPLMSGILSLLERG